MLARLPASKHLSARRVAAVCCVVAPSHSCVVRASRSLVDVVVRFWLRLPMRGALAFVLFGSSFLVTKHLLCAESRRLVVSRLRTRLCALARSLTSILSFCACRCASRLLLACWLVLFRFHAHHQCAASRHSSCCAFALVLRSRASLVLLNSFTSF